MRPRNRKNTEDNGAGWSAQQDWLTAGLKEAALGVVGIDNSYKAVDPVALLEARREQRPDEGRVRKAFT